MGKRVAVGAWALWVGVGATSAAGAATGPSGVFFQCPAKDLSTIERDMDGLYAELGFPKGQIVISKETGGLRYRLKTAPDDTSTFDLADRRELDIQPDILSYTRGDGKKIQGAFTSRKEILASLMQNGREYVLKGRRCSVSALKENIGVRQSIAKWAKIAERRWTFPEYWNEKHELIEKETTLNPKYWVSQGAIAKGVTSRAAVADPFIGAFHYEIYCQLATRLIAVQGIFDYFASAAPNPSKLALLEKAAQGAPLLGLKPKLDDKGNVTAPGKYQAYVESVPGDNFIAGDSAYISNDDAVSRKRAGYEGSNFVYLGGGLFAYVWANDPASGLATDLYYGSPAETLDNHLLAVYHWRYGITENWEHDPRRKFLTDAQVRALRRSPQDGGLLMDHRVVWADGVGLPTGFEEF